MNSGRLLAGLVLVAPAAAIAYAAPDRSALPPAEEARAHLRDILLTPEFARAAGPSALERWIDALREWLFGLLSLAGVSGDLGTRIGTTVAWAVALAAVVGVLMLLLRRHRRRAAAPASVSAWIEPRLPSAEWTARVTAALERGDLREAARSAYLAAVVRFEEQGVWRVDPARTPREYARLVALADPRRGPFSELAAEFERVWYGHRPAEPARLWQWLEGCGCARS